MELIRGIVSGEHHERPSMTPEQRRLWDEQSRLKEMVQRLDRVDATIGAQAARYHQVYPHPHRRAGER